MAVAKSQRSLVVVAHLASTSKRYKQLYRFLDSATVPVVRALCGRAYARVLVTEDGTLGNFAETIALATAPAETLATEVVFAYHGLPGAIAFEDGKRSMSEVHAALVTVPNRAKLRLAYNLCCHGATHADALHRVGFDAVIGSKGVNANSAFELPAVLGAWAAGQPLGLVVETGNNSTNVSFSDAFASLMFKNVNSVKELSGANAARLRISSTPTP